MISEQQHEEFKEHLRDSQRAVFAIAAHFNRTGNDILIPGLCISPTAGEWRECSDKGDLYIRPANEKVPWQRWEVKYRKSWRGKSFPYDSIFIERCVRLNKMDPKPFGWVTMNEDLSAAVLVFYKNRESWWRAPVDGHVNHREKEEMW